VKILSGSVEQDPSHAHLSIVDLTDRSCVFITASAAY
jgi:hypothetical protein